MKAAELIEEVERIGGELTLHGDRLRYRLPANVGPELLEELRRHKGEVIGVLRQHSATGQSIQFRPEEPVTREMLREATDPVAQAVFQLLREGEWIDSHGRIRKAN